MKDPAINKRIAIIGALKGLDDVGIRMLCNLSHDEFELLRLVDQGFDAEFIRARRNSRNHILNELAPIVKLLELPNG